MINGSFYIMSSNIFYPRICFVFVIFVCSIIPWRSGRLAMHPLVSLQMLAMYCRGLSTVYNCWKLIIESWHFKASKFVGKFVILWLFGVRLNAMPLRLLPMSDCQLSLCFVPFVRPSMWLTAGRAGSGWASEWVSGYRGSAHCRVDVLTASTRVPTGRYTAIRSVHGIL